MPNDDSSYKSPRRVSPTALPQNIPLTKISAAIAVKFGKASFQSIKTSASTLSKFSHSLRKFPLLVRCTLAIMMVIGIFILVLLPDEKNKHLVYGSIFPIYIAMVVSFLSSYFCTIQIKKRFILVKLRRAYRIGLIYCSLNPRRKREVSNGPR